MSSNLNQINTKNSIHSDVKISSNLQILINNIPIDIISYGINHNKPSNNQPSNNQSYQEFYNYLLTQKTNETLFLIDQPNCLCHDTICSCKNTDTIIENIIKSEQDKKSFIHFLTKQFLQDEISDNSSINFKKCDNRVEIGFFNSLTVSDLQKILRNLLPTFDEEYDHTKFYSINKILDEFTQIYQKVFQENGKYFENKGSVTEKTFIENYTYLTELTKIITLIKQKYQNNPNFLNNQHLVILKETILHMFYCIINISSLTVKINIINNIMQNSTKYNKFILVFDVSHITFISNLLKSELNASGTINNTINESEKLYNLIPNRFNIPDIIEYLSNIQK